MNKTHLKSLIAAGVAATALVGSAQAGGFSRGNADTDILFEQGNVTLRMSATFVMPERKYTKNPVPGLVGTNYAEDYVVPSVAAKFNITESVRCALTAVENNGGKARYAVPNRSGKSSEEFETTEFGATCGVKFQAGPGNVWFLGGAYAEKFDYDRQNDFSAAGLPSAELTLEGQEYGYRAGIAYEIPDIALRAQLMYRSGTSYGAEGNLAAPAGVLCIATGLPSLCALPRDQKLNIPSLGYGELPQTVELKLQSGIAPGWLAFGSVKWADWSVTESLDVVAVTGTEISKDLYFWKDGWTVTGGVGHAFNDRFSGVAALTWDSGVGTGYDLSSDTWTLSVGGALKDTFGGELRGGVAASYLTSAAEDKYFANGVDRNQAVDDGWAFAFNVGYAIKW